MALAIWLCFASTLLPYVSSSCRMKTRRNTLKATADNQIIENVAIYAPKGAAAITVNGFKSVTIRNVNITFG